MFYSRLCALCKEHGINITNLISELNFSAGNLSRWKKGGEPRGNTLSKLADYFHVSTDYLLGRTDSKEPPEASGGPLRSALLGNFDQLNLEGQERLVETSDDMVSSGKYKKSRAPELGAAADA